MHDACATRTPLSNLCADRAGPPPWHADLRLRFARTAAGCTRLVHNQHRGPLRVQRLLYPEGDQLAHTLILHPPGGIAGGDVLDINVQLEAGSQVLCTTPGASKWYHAQRGAARQSVHLHIGADACLEWLPQESILFDAADAFQQTTIDLHPHATHFGWDIIQFGRVAAGADWLSGRWRQILTLRRGGRERWREAADLMADDALRDSPLGLAGFPVHASAWAAAPQLERDLDTLLARLRECAAQSGLPCGISYLPAPTGLLLIRALGPGSEVVRALLESLWRILRPPILGRAAQRPRIWHT